MKPFFLYLRNNELQYSADSIFETDKYIFLAESNLPINSNDVDESGIKNNNFYVLIIVDKQTHDIIAKYGRNSYCHSLYGYHDKNSLFLDLSLKHLLKNIDIIPTLNLKCAKEFIKYGFLTDGKCLINDIKLLAPLKKLNWTDNKVFILDDTFALDTDTVAKSYTECLSQALPTDEANIVLPLSGGFDSTFLAYLLRQHKNIVTITVGSPADSNNEFATAKNTAAYLGLQNKQINTTREGIEYLPKIVELFEGEMFDPGVFVCWAMVDYVKKADLKNNLFITGDGSDQLLNLIFYKSALKKQPIVDRHTRHFGARCPKHCFYYLVVKKLEWILHENDIHYIMPFLSEAFLSLAKSTQTVDKKEYKDFIKATLPEAITKMLAKNGGMVQERYFIPQSYIKKFLTLISTPKYSTGFQPHSKSFRPLLYKIYVIIFNYIYIENKSINMPFTELLDILIQEGKQ